MILCEKEHYFQKYLGRGYVGLSARYFFDIHLDPWGIGMNNLTKIIFFLDGFGEPTTNPTRHDLSSGKFKPSFLVHYANAAEYQQLLGWICAISISVGWFIKINN